MRIGFVGVGKMGKPMVLRLAGEGHEVTVHDRSQEAVAAVAGTVSGTISGTGGIAAAPSPADVARGAEVVITMLPNGKVVREVATELAAAMADGAVLVDMSTSYPLETTALRKALPPHAGLVDAPVSGGVWRAELGKLTIMVGGRADEIDRVEPALAAMGSVIRTGPLGSGHAMKLLNNYLSASGLAAACEAVLIGRAFGLDPDLMADVFNVSTGKNNATEVKLKQQVNNGKFAAGFAMGLMAKDLTLARKLAGDMGVDAKGLDACQALYARAVEALGEGADHTEVFKVLAPR
jgi:3-hydroxyisobutyrate dehydrogenase